ncbi:MauE/DoxX family redox-associated membrane protein [Ascidiimonas sp. W6]|uniref:DoxX family protein n=1 Tax=Ascidiimonas meishanensis TaxID=3128903 RepID=UPI0030ED86A1
MKANWHMYLLALILLIAGIFHFIRPKAFMRIMPRYLPAHKFLVLLSGGVEIGAAIMLLLPQTRSLAAWLIILILIGFIPVHTYMISNIKAGLNLPKPVLYGRLILQAFLIFWAFQYT